MAVPDEWTEIKDSKGDVIGLEPSKAFALDKAGEALAKLKAMGMGQSPAYHQLKAKLQAKGGGQTPKPAPPQGTYYDKQTGVELFDQPKHMEQPSKPDCKCVDCFKEYSDHIEAYEEWQEQKFKWDQSQKEHQLALKKIALAEKRAAADSYVEATKEWWAQKEKAKAGGSTFHPQAVIPGKKNPILMIKPTTMTSEATEGSTWEDVVKAKQLKKATPVAGTSHAKGGKFGGVSNYNDADVAEAKEYMESVLGLSEMSINGRALEHILAEVWGQANKQAQQVNLEALNVLASFEVRIATLSKTVAKLTKALEQSQAELVEAEKNGTVIKKLDKEKVAELKTGRRIKE